MTGFPYSDAELVAMADNHERYDHDDRARARADIAGRKCSHTRSMSYSTRGCDECWDGAYDA